MDNVTFRNLKADEIDARVQSEHDKGIILLLYKDARCDMNILDETVGANNWQRKHYDCKGNLFCSVGIKCGDEWIWKDDAGAESYTEKQKGEASDSFKRACFNWGIGRELYTSPFIWVPSGMYRTNEKTGKVKDKFTVSAIEYENNKILFLEIKNKSNDVAFTYGKSKSSLVACPKCNHIIKPTRTKNGALEPQEVLNKYSMCADCYNKQKVAEHGA